VKVLLINIDSKLPNIALKKIELWHKNQDDEVIWDMPMQINEVDKVYASCIFTSNKWQCEQYKGLRGDTVIGGTGYDLTIKLPTEIDNMKPKINYGFTTRGCIRKCPFCFVWKSEGHIRIVGDLYDIWDGKCKKVTLLDNNILAAPEHFKIICTQIRKENIKVDFNQGLDIRLLTPELADVLNSTPTADLRFAFDSPSLESIVRTKIAMLRQHSKKRPFVYVLVGFDTTFEEDLHRLNVLKELGCRAYVMRHENTPNRLIYIRLAEWANQFWTFAKYTFEDFCYYRNIDRLPKSRKPILDQHSMMEDM